MAELKITAANFENEVLNSDKPVLLDFYADWCGPCKMLAPVVHEIAEENAGTLKVGKINVDEQMELAMRFQVSSIPMLVAKMASLLYEAYINRHSKIGRKIAGTRFMTLILVTFSIFRLRATISREPTQVISAITASPSRGDSSPARREMAP